MKSAGLNAKKMIPEHRKNKNHCNRGQMFDQRERVKLPVSKCEWFTIQSCEIVKRHQTQPIFRVILQMKVTAKSPNLSEYGAVQMAVNP